MISNCHFKGKPKCEKCSKFGHTTKDCWSGKGKGKEKEKTCECCTVPPMPKKAKVKAHIVEKDDDIDESMSTILQNVTMSSNEENATSTYDWIEDSGSTSHVMNKQTLLTDFVPKIETITGFSGNKVQSHGCSTTMLLSQIRKKIFKIILAHVYYVPQSQNNILSTKCLDRQGATIIHQNGHALIYNKHKQLIIKGKLKHLYKHAAC